MAARRVGVERVRGELGSIPFLPSVLPPLPLPVPFSAKTRPGILTKPFPPALRLERVMWP